MTQEFRTFTQRKTDAERAETRLFNVRAKTLVDQFGNDIVDSSGKNAFDDRFENLNLSGANNSGLPQPWLFYALTGGLH